MNKPKSQTDKQFKEKIIKTFIHGFLHLLGFDHVKNKDYLKMLKEEEKYLNQLSQKLSKLKKNLYIDVVYLLFLGAITSLSLPPFNLLIINFLSFSLFFIFLIKKKAKNINYFFSMAGYLDLDIF